MVIWWQAERCGGDIEGERSAERAAAACLNEVLAPFNELREDFGLAGAASVIVAGEKGT